MSTSPYYTTLRSQDNIQHSPSTLHPPDLPDPRLTLDATYYASHLTSDTVPRVEVKKLGVGEGRQVGTAALGEATVEWNWQSEQNWWKFSQKRNHFQKWSQRWNQNQSQKWSQNLMLCLAELHLQPNFYPPGLSRKPQLLEKEFLIAQKKSLWLAAEPGKRQEDGLLPGLWPTLLPQAPLLHCVNARGDDCHSLPSDAKSGWVWGGPPNALSCLMPTAWISIWTVEPLLPFTLGSILVLTFPTIPHHSLLAHG
ncbi:hypothetical protein JB92DRAFT_3120410 [Gautieria morchelliformis]|nr:hypothetical protein JB92DRAFT_3120410 [Gautieria morchelliformis]